MSTRPANRAAKALAIKHLMEQLDINQVDLSTATAISQSALSRKLNTRDGARPAKISKLELDAICEALHTTVDELNALANELSDGGTDAGPPSGASGTSGDKRSTSKPRPNGHGGPMAFKPAML